MRKITAGVAIAGTALGVGLALPASASGGHVDWKGQTWDVSSNASATVDASDHVTITRSGTADATLHVNRLAPVNGSGESFVNQHGTPWVEVSYVDNGASRGVDFFVDDESGSGNPRLQAGSLFSCGAIGWVRDNANEVQDPPVFCVGHREAGKSHTIYVGERLDGTIDYNVDGTWYSSTEFRDNGEHMDFHEVYLRLRGNSGTSATFTDFRYGDSHVMGNFTCTGAVANTIVFGDVNVPAGATCVLDHDTITGKVKVDEGGSLDMKASSTGDNVEAKKPASLVVRNGSTIGHDLKVDGTTGDASAFGFGYNLICNTTIGHDMVVQNSTSDAPWMIGTLLSHGGPCVKSNAIGNNAKIQENAAAVDFSDNNPADGPGSGNGGVGHDLTVAKNSGDITANNNLVGHNAVFQDNAHQVL